MHVDIDSVRSTMAESHDLIEIENCMTALLEVVVSADSNYIVLMLRKVESSHGACCENWFRRYSCNKRCEHTLRKYVCQLKIVTGANMIVRVSLLTPRDSALITPQPNIEIQIERVFVTEVKTFMVFYY